MKPLKDVKSIRQFLKEQIEGLTAVLDNADAKDVPDLIDLFQDGDLEFDGVTMKAREMAFYSIGFVLGVAYERGKTVLELLDEEGL